MYESRRMHISITRIDRHIDRYIFQKVSCTSFMHVVQWHKHQTSLPFNGQMERQT